MLAMQFSFIWNIIILAIIILCCFCACSDSGTQISPNNVVKQLDVITELSIDDDSPLLEVATAFDKYVSSNSFNRPQKYLVAPVLNQLYDTLSSDDIPMLIKLCKYFNKTNYYPFTTFLTTSLLDALHSGRINDGTELELVLEILNVTRVIRIKKNKYAISSRNFDRIANQFYRLQQYPHLANEFADYLFNILDLYSLSNKKYVSKIRQMFNQLQLNFKKMLLTSVLISESFISYMLQARTNRRNQSNYEDILRCLLSSISLTEILQMPSQSEIISWLNTLTPYNSHLSSLSFSNIEQVPYPHRFQLISLYVDSSSKISPKLIQLVLTLSQDDLRGFYDYDVPQCVIDACILYVVSRELFTDFLYHNHKCIIEMIYQFQMGRVPNELFINFIANVPSKYMDSIRADPIAYAALKSAIQSAFHQSLMADDPSILDKWFLSIPELLEMLLDILPPFIIRYVQLNKTSHFLRSLYKRVSFKDKSLHRRSRIKQFHDLLSALADDITIDNKLTMNLDELAPLLDDRIVHIIILEYPANRIKTALLNCQSLLLERGICAPTVKKITAWLHLFEILDNATKECESNAEKIIKIISLIREFPHDEQLVRAIALIPLKILATLEQVYVYLHKYSEVPSSELSQFVQSVQTASLSDFSDDFSPDELLRGLTNILFDSRNVSAFGAVGKFRADSKILSLVPSIAKAYDQLLLISQDFSLSLTDELRGELSTILDRIFSTMIRIVRADFHQRRVSFKVHVDAMIDIPSFVRTCVNDTDRVIFPSPYGLFPIPLLRIYNEYLQNPPLFSTSCNPVNGLLTSHDFWTLSISLHLLLRGLSSIDLTFTHLVLPEYLKTMVLALAKARDNLMKLLKDIEIDIDFKNLVVQHLQAITKMDAFQGVVTRDMLIDAFTFGGLDLSWIDLILAKHLYCIYCSYELPDNTTTCPNCGRTQPNIDLENLATEEIQIDFESIGG